MRTALLTVAFLLALSVPCVSQTTAPTTVSSSESDTISMLRKMIASLQKQIASLKAENYSFKIENAKLKKEDERAKAISEKQRAERMWSDPSIADDIKKGMTRNEAVSVIGRPPTSETTDSEGNVLLTWQFTNASTMALNGQAITTGGPTGEVIVYLRDDKVLRFEKTKQQ